MDFVQEGLNNGDPMVIGCLVAFIVVALTICEYRILVLFMVCLKISLKEVRLVDHLSPMTPGDSWTLQ